MMAPAERPPPPPAPTPDLALFFAAMKPLLCGLESGSAVELSLGPSPSGTGRLDVYRILVDRQKRQLLRALFEPLRVACRELQPALFVSAEFAAVRSALFQHLPALSAAAERESASFGQEHTTEILFESMLTEYQRTHQPQSWDPNRFGEALPDFLSDLVEATGLPGYLPELADYTFAAYCVRTTPRLTPDDGVGLESTLLLREYEYDVHGYQLAIRAGLPAPQLAPLLPREHRHTLLFARRRSDDELYVLYATPLTVLVIARRIQAQLELSEHDPVPEYSADDLAQLAAVEAQLIEWEVLAPANPLGSPACTSFSP